MHGKRQMGSFILKGDLVAAEVSWNQKAAPVMCRRVETMAESIYKNN
jgi:hypothetical protein